MNKIVLPLDPGEGFEFATVDNLRNCTPITR